MNLPPPALHEIITSLHRNRSRVNARIRKEDRRMETEPVRDRMEADPAYKAYLEATRAARVQRIENINQLIHQFESLNK